MTNYKNRITLRSITFLMSLIILTVFVSCGDDGSTAQTPKEETEAWLQGSWSVSETSELANITMDKATIGVTMTATGFTFSGDLSNYVGGGTFTVSETGQVENLAINITSSEIALDGTPNITVDKNLSTVVVSFSTQLATARGLGTFTIILAKG